jgi:hypothetical protein
MPIPSAASLIARASKARASLTSEQADAQAARVYAKAIVLADARVVVADLLGTLVENVPDDTWDDAATKGHCFVNVCPDGIGIRAHTQSGSYPDGNPRMVNIANLIQDRRGDLKDGAGTALDFANRELEGSGFTLVVQFHGGLKFTTHGGPNKGQEYNGGLLIHCTWDLPAYEAYQQAGRERRAKSRKQGPTQTLDEYKRGAPLKPRA